MKKTFITLLFCLCSMFSFASTILIEGFEYANHDLGTPIGWQSDNQWLCGYLDKDHNRTAHTGNWYAFTNEDDSWMFMELYMSEQLRYRYSCWAVSDGSYQLEFWVGNSPTPEGMSQQFINVTVNSGNYELVEAYVETLSQNHQYIGIHAIAAEGAYHLTIDDVVVDMVDRYDMVVTPMELDTVLYPGDIITFSYSVHNTGYEPMHIFMSGLESDFFTNVQFTENGSNHSSFPTEPDQVVPCTCTTTLSPHAKPGSRVWLDIMFTVSCDCITRMATIWVTVLGEVDQFPLEAHFDHPDFLHHGWIVMDDSQPKWEWIDEGDGGITPYDNSPGMLGFKASEENDNSLIVSPKLKLNDTNNQVRMHLYRTNSSGNDSRVNVYLSPDMSLREATLLETFHRNTSLSPTTETSGWYECNVNFDSPEATGFIILEAVGDQGEDLFVDEILISNEPLPVTTTVSEQDTEATVSITPNPANDHVLIRANELSTVEVRDVLGRTLQHKDCEGDFTELMLNELNPGVYFISVTSTRGTSTHKIIKR